MTIEIVCVTDEELERLVERGGPQCVEARIVKDLRKRRAKDIQAYAFRVGHFYFTGPFPDTQAEAEIIDMVEEYEKEGFEEEE